VGDVITIRRLRDSVLAPIVVVREALADGDTAYAAAVAEALEFNLAGLVEALEGETACVR
jgi:hypothetical protein